MKKVLTIAGSDCSAGAGIQADLKTMTYHDVYGMSVITSLTAQNTTGVYNILKIPAEFTGEQLDCIFTDIFPDAVKTGMLLNSEIVEKVSEKLRFYKAKNIVVDTVMVSTSGKRLLSENGVKTLIAKLFCISDLVTPNIPEAEILSGITIRTQNDMILAAKEISKYVKGAVLIKGGHFLHNIETSDDLLYYESTPTWFRCKKIISSNTHGTGCTLSAAIACNLALGCDIPESVKKAKDYVTDAISKKLNLGKGNGPIK